MLLLTALTGLAAPVGSALNYQGRLNVSGSPAADGLYDFRFTLQDAATLGSPVGSAVAVSAVPVTNGLFTVPLDFGVPAFTTGEARWLQLEVNTNGVTPLAPLNPRQRLTPAPQALYAGSAATAASASSVAAGAVTSSGLASGAVGGTAIADGSITSVDLNVNLLNTTFWKLGGNDVSAAPGANIIGSTNDQPVEFRVNNFRALRLEPRGSGFSPNMLGGYHQNNAGNASANLRGAAIAGGGTQGAINQVEGNYGFIGAGIGGHAAGSAMVGAGAYNSALGPFSLVGSGIANTNRGLYAALVAGTNNFVGPGADSAFVGGGAGNRALGLYSSVSGGACNTASGTNSTISGGSFNVAAGQSSFAAGNRAKANHTGAFVWADATDADFVSTTNNQFLIRASGGVGINKTNPATTLDVNGGVRARGGPPGPFGVNNNGYAFSGNGGDDDGGMFSSANGQMEFYGNSLERMRITEAGNVGIGTTAPASALHVNGTVTATSFSGNGAGLANLTAANLAGSVPSAALTSIPAGNLTGTVPAAALGNAWQIGGNSGTAGGLGTLDSQPMTFFSGNSRALLLETKVVNPGPLESITAVNVLGGASINTIGNGVIGATIGGGGSSDFNGFLTSPYPNRVLDAFGTVGGGRNNTAGSAGANIFDGSAATVAGGEGNLATGRYSFVGGGLDNLAAGYGSFAAGNQARANHNGSFVWADSQNANFASTAENQFNIRAAGGLRLSGSGGAELLTVDSGGQLSALAGVFTGDLFVGGDEHFGAQARQMLNLWGTQYGIGVQSGTLYSRADNGATHGFAWYRGGVHSDAAQDPGAGGQKLMALTAAGLVVNGAGNSVQGTTSSREASGVYGQNDGEGIGIAGRTTAGGSAVFGDNASPLGWAGNFNGRVFVRGELNAASTVTAERFIATAPDLAADVIPVLGMVWIKPGTFIMGSPTGDADSLPDERPQTVVTLTRGFWMGVHEVTQNEWISVIGSNPSYFSLVTVRPVERVTWNNATNYCRQLTLNERTAGRLPAGWGYRLPTEAEWEYACRAGARTTRFSYGDDLTATTSGVLGNYAWFGDATLLGTTHPVEFKLANPWGLMDLHGNVFEWCQDWYGPYPGGSVTDPQGPGSGSERVVRGGSYLSLAALCRSASRLKFAPAHFGTPLGFRVVLSSGQP